VREGDTLQSIAQSLFGDAGLWYTIAQANGITGDFQLREGQILTLPRGVVRTTNNAGTYRAYNPASVVGDVQPDTPSPTTPQPQSRGKKNKCGIFGAIILAVVAVAVTVATGGALTTAFGPVLGGALSAAAGSVVSQAVGVATGIQDRFSFKGVALAALAGGVSGGLRSIGALDKLGDVAGGAVRSVAGNVLSQGAATIVGLQSRFNFAAVAAAGAVGAASGAIGGTSFGSRLAANTAGAIAGAATRSIVEGTSFGDNIVASLPDAIGSTIGALVGIRLARAAREGGMSGSKPRSEQSESQEKDIVVTGNRRRAVESDADYEARIAAEERQASREEPAIVVTAADLKFRPTTQRDYIRLADLDADEANYRQIIASEGPARNDPAVLAAFAERRDELIALNAMATAAEINILRQVLPPLDLTLSASAVVQGRGTVGDYFNVIGAVLPGVGRVAGRLLEARGALNGAIRATASRGPIVATKGSRATLGAADRETLKEIVQGARTLSERKGLVFAQREAQRIGFDRVLPSLTYRGNQGIDLAVQNTATGRYAVFEAKGGFTQKSLSSLTRDTRGIVQGSARFIDTRVRSYIRFGDGRSVAIARDLQAARRSSNIDSFASLYGSRRTYQLPLTGSGIRPATLVP
jgi:hypothetical protein